MTDKPEVDPAAIWWNKKPEPVLDPARHLQAQPWRWRYSFWTGIMYGPIPVGIIIGIPLLILLYR